MRIVTLSCFPKAVEAAVGDPEHPVTAGAGVAMAAAPAIGLRCVRCMLCVHSFHSVDTSATPPQRGSLPSTGKHKICAYEDPGKCSRHDDCEKCPHPGGSGHASRGHDRTSHSSHSVVSIDNTKCGSSHHYDEGPCAGVIQTTKAVTRRGNPGGLSKQTTTLERLSGVLALVQPPSLRCQDGFSMLPPHR